MDWRGGERTARNSARERILNASLQVFGEQGYRGTTTREIARRASVNEVTIFRQFKSKRALFDAVVAEKSPLAQITRQVSFEASGPIDDLILQNAKAVLTVLRANRHLLMVMFGDAWRQPATRRAIRDSVVAKGIVLVTEFMRVQMDAGMIRQMDPEIAARALMGMIQAYFLTKELLEGGKPDQEYDDRILRGFASIFLEGMRPDKGAGE